MKLIKKEKKRSDEKFNYLNGLKMKYEEEVGGQYMKREVNGKWKYYVVLNPRNIGIG